MRIVTRLFLCRALLIASVAYLAMAVAPLHAQIVAMVNDDPITTYDVQQRQRYAALTTHFGDNIKSLLTSEATKQRFQKMMMAANPRSQEEAQQVAERIKKQIIEEAKNRVLNEGGGMTRKAALEALIEEHLKLQAAQNLKITVTDKEVEEQLGQRINNGDKSALSQFFQQFEANGVSKKTILQVQRAQLAWVEVIKRQYGPRLQSVFAALPDVSQGNDADFVFEVKVLRLSVAATNDEKAVSKRMLEADNIKQKFSGCKDIVSEAKLVGATIVSQKVKLASFPKDIQPLIVKAGEGQMTPPQLVGDAVELYAVCKKTLSVEAGKAKSAEAAKPNLRMQEWDRVSRVYYDEIKKKASVDYRDSSYR